MSTIYNSDNFNLTDWALTLPINTSNGTTGTAEEISPTDLSSPYFYANPDGSMTFYAPTVGATMANSSSTNSELSELNSNGTAAGWSLSEGGTMSATLAVNSLPTLATGGQGAVIIGELAGTNCALVQLYDDGGNIYFKNLLLYEGAQNTFQLTDAAGNTPTVALGQKFSYSISAQGSTLAVNVYINGVDYSSVTSIDSSWQAQTLHFTAGIVNADAGTSGTALPQATGAGQATFYGLDMSHTSGDGFGGLQSNAPVVQTESFTGAENQVITGNMLTNDTAPAGLTLSAAAITQTTAQGGTVVENSNGTFTYTPPTGFTGADSFTYTLKDGSGLAATGAVDITVNSSTPTLLPPVAHIDNVTGAENLPITGNVLTNDTDPNGLALSVTPATLTTANGGTVVENANGTFTYTPATGYVGSDTFNYTAQDTAGLSTTSTVNVAVTPTAGYTLVFDPSFSTLSLESSSNPKGTWDTTYPYATAGSAAFSGRTLSTNDEAEFYSDATVGVNPFSVNNGVMTITAAPATASMLATEAAANSGATLPYTSGLLTTYTSFAQTYGLYEVTAKLPAGQGLWPAIWMLPASGAWPPEIDIMEAVNNPTTDYMTLHTGTSNTAEGSTTQVPTASTGFNTYAVDWEPTTITFYVDGKEVFQEATPSDMHQPMYMLMNLAVGGTGSWPGATNSSTVFPAQMQISSVQVYASPNTIADYNTVGVQTTTSLPPVAVTDSATGTENKVITGNVLTNDSDPNGLALSVTAATITTAHGGTVVQNANGTFTYTPATNFVGTDTYNYTLNDSAGLTATGTVNLTVNAPAYLPPVAGTDNFTGTVNHAITGNVITNDSDPNGLALSVTAATVTTAHGTAVENANGTFTYTPATNFVGTDSFSYTVKDSAGLSSIGTVNVTVSAPPTAPVAQTDYFASSENDPMFGNVLANNGTGADTDPNGLGLSLAAATLKTAHGATVTEATDGTITYIPAANFVGTDTFNYTLKDSAGHTSTGTVDVAVEPISTTGVVTFGYGSNMLFGAAGDTFAFTAGNLGTGVDTIRNFSLAENDKIDISNVLSGHYNPATQVLSNFVNIATSGSNSILEVDLTGHAGAAGWTQITTIFSVTGLNEQSLVAHGELIV